WNRAPPAAMTTNNSTSAIVCASGAMSRGAAGDSVPAASVDTRTSSAIVIRRTAGRGPVTQELSTKARKVTRRVGEGRKTRRRVGPSHGGRIADTRTAGRISNRGFTRAGIRICATGWVGECVTGVGLRPGRVLARGQRNLTRSEGAHHDLDASLRSVQQLDPLHAGGRAADRRAVRPAGRFESEAPL